MHWTHLSKTYFQFSRKWGKRYHPGTRDHLTASGFTKKIIAEKSQRCVSAVLTHSTCPPRIFIGHIAAGSVDKNVQVRNYTAGHLKTFLDIHGARSKHAIETTPGLLDSLETSLVKTLGDNNPQTREQARLAFWAFNGIWPSRAQAIMGNLDGAAKKQLEKVDPRGAAESATTTRPPTKKPAASSSMSALLAEKRRAKAAEMAAGRNGESSRAVSSPVPSASPVPPMARSTSAQFTPIGRASPLRASSGRTEDPTSPSPSSGALPKAALSAASQASSDVVDLNSPDLSSVPAFADLDISRTGTPGASSAPRHGLGLIHPEGDVEVNGTGSVDQTPSKTGSSPGGIDPELKKQADEAVHAAQQLLDVSGDSSSTVVPATPLRPNGAAPTGMGGSAQRYKTPLNKFVGISTPSRPPWEDSPKPEAMTPLLFAQLKERKHERSWWIKRQELLDKASPLKSAQPDPAAAIVGDLEELEKGTPNLKNLQKLALFSESHPLSIDEEEGEGDERIWKEGKLFDRIFEALTAFLDPAKVSHDVGAVTMGADQKADVISLSHFSSKALSFSGRWSSINGRYSKTGTMR